MIKNSCVLPRFLKQKFLLSLVEAQIKFQLATWPHLQYEFEMTAFKIQTRDKRPPPPPKKASQLSSTQVLDSLYKKICGYQVISYQVISYQLIQAFN